MINQPSPAHAFASEEIRPPEPMARLLHEVISPANIQMEARLSRAKPLSKLQIWKLKREAKSLVQKIQSLEPEATEALYNQVREAYQETLAKLERLKQYSQNAPEHDHIRLMMRRERQRLEWLKVKGSELQAHREKIRQLVHTQEAILQRIRDNPQVIERQKEIEESHRIQRKEAAAYEQLIIERLSQLGYCHRWVDKQGRKRVDSIHFSQCHITMDAVYLKLAASHRDLFGGWRTRLPYGVKIADIVKEETCYELSMACQRQVTSKSNFLTGPWLIVHRIDTIDGLLNEVAYAKLMKEYPQKEHNRFPLCIGVAQNLHIWWLNLTECRHWLIAGYTGSGKSNFINSLICNLISMHSPEEVRLVLVDLKDGIEFSFYENIPHLHGKVIDSVALLADKLNELEAIMQARNQEMKGKARSLREYQAKYPDAKMPRIICIIDEVASTMAHGELTKRITNSLRALTSKGRAPGIHVILSTQRPSVDAIDGTIKVNLDARIVGRMPSHVDSQTVLGTGDAKELAAIAGRMIIMTGPDPVPIQTPFIEEDDIFDALKTAMQYPRPEPLPVPEDFNQVEEWTPEKIVGLSLRFLGGNISHSAVWAEIKDENRLSYRQTRELVERIWKMDCIPFEGKQYHVERGSGKTKKLVEIAQSDDSTISA
jgi:hypothetical protein